MKSTTRYVGLDVSKATIAVGLADDGREKARFWGTIENLAEKVRHLMENLGAHESLMVCYEAGPTGYGIYRQLTHMGISCIVVAPTLIPTRSGDRVKTDKRDALRLAELLRAGELTPVFVPDRDDEALRDLVRAREDAKADQLRARHRLSKFLLRNDQRPPEKLKTWGVTHMAWLKKLKLDGAQDIVLREYLHAIDETQGRIDRLEAAMHIMAEASVHAPTIHALQTLRGVKEVTAVTLVTEIGQFSRFRHPGQLMAYAGLVPREYSSGSGRWQGKLTKTGNAHLRRVVIESAWSYRYRPALKGDLLKRQTGQSAEVRNIAWRAQERLHRKYVRLALRGKSGGQTAAAVARELLGFAWAIGCAVEAEKLRANAS